MRCDLISPFRVDFNIPKHYTRAYADKWQKTFKVANDKLVTEPSLQSASLGNYGGAKMRELHEKSRVLYGEEGIMDPGYFFKEHHLLLLSGTPDLPAGELPDLGKGQITNPTDCLWECRLYDSNLAVLILSFKLESLDAVKACHQHC